MTEAINEKTDQAVGMLKWLWLTAVVVIIDQITKLAVDGSFDNPLPDL